MSATTNKKEIKEKPTPRKLAGAAKLEKAKKDKIIAEAIALQQLEEQEKKKAFHEGYQKLVAKTGYSYSPVVQITANGTQMHLDLIKVNADGNNG